MDKDEEKYMDKELSKNELKLKILKTIRDHNRDSEIDLSNMEIINVLSTLIERKSQ